MNDPSASPLEAADLRPRNVGEILDAGIKLFLRNPRLLVIAAAVVIPLQIASGIVLLSITPTGDTTSLTTAFTITKCTHQQANSGAVLGARRERFAGRASRTIGLDDAHARHRGAEHQSRKRDGA